MRFLTIIGLIGLGIIIIGASKRDLAYLDDKKIKDYTANDITLIMLFIVYIVLFTIGAYSLFKKS
jgi:hypothetical protein